MKTPDGNSHLLRLESAIPNGTAAPSLTPDGNGFYQVDFAGYSLSANFDANGNGSFNWSQTFLGTLVFATVDGTYIRVETNTNTMRWVAYSPDGTQVSGPITAISGVGATDSDADSVTDRNGNYLSIAGSCSEGTACTETLTDAQSRAITINYAADANQSQWTDSLTWPGVNGNLTTAVAWQATDLAYGIYSTCLNYPGEPTFPPALELSLFGAGPCSIVAYDFLVSGVQLPSATANGAAAFYTFGYGPSVSGDISWGEVHSVSMCTGVPNSSTPGQAPASCTQHFSEQYRYLYDTPATFQTNVVVAQPTNGPITGTFSSRPVGTITNPLFSKTLSYGSSAETTTYSITPVENASGITYAGATNTVTGPDNAKTLYSFNSNFLPYKTVAPDGTITQQTWDTNSASSKYNSPGISDSQSGLVINPYVAATVQTAPTTGNNTTGRSVTLDENGNPASVAEYDWFSSGSLSTDSTGMLSGIPSSAPLLRTTATTYYATSSSNGYWAHRSTSGPSYVRAPQLVTVTNSGGTVQAATQYNYDNALTTANMTQQLQCTLAQGTCPTTATLSSSNAAVSSWAYNSNGNVKSTTDPNGNVSQTTYNSNSLYPTQVTNSLGQTTRYSYDSNSGLLTSSADPNSVTTTNGYDSLGRQTSVTQSDPADSITRLTSTSYDDVGLSVTTRQDRDTYQDGKLVSATYYDPLGRVIETYSRGITTQTAYQYAIPTTSSAASNPYLTTGDSTMGWTLTSRDSMGRVVNMDSFSGAAQPAWASGKGAGTSGRVTYSYAGPQAQVTDGAGNTHVYKADGLGRITAVTEPNGNLTYYAYDAPGKSERRHHGQPDAQLRLRLGVAPDFGGESGKRNG